VVGFFAAVFYIYAIVDCILFERERVRGLPKGAWVPIVIVFPIIGALLWFLVGRGPKPRAAGPVRRGPAPDDDPAFLERLARDRAQQEHIRKLEQQLAELDDPDPDDPDPDDPDPKAPKAPKAPKKGNSDPDQSGRRDA
jgi:hypothetical protein